MTKIKNQLNTFNTPIASGVFKSVAWRSLTCKEEIRVPEIKEAWKSALFWSKTLKSDVLSHAEVINVLYGMTVYEYLQQPINRLALYQSKSKYKNHKQII
jgi:hypothetical protein